MCIEREEMKRQQIEIIQGTGHSNILATHRTTLEFTRAKTLTKKGDCILVVNIDRGLIDFDQNFTQLCRNINCRITIDLKCGNLSEKIIGYGHPDLILQHPTDIIIRKSQFICPKTLMIRSNKVAKDINREFLSQLQNPKQKIRIQILAEILE